MKKRTGKMVECLKCKQLFYVKLYRIGKTKYCSLKCYNLCKFKQFCFRKHDTFIVGRNKHHICNQCYVEDHQGKKPKQFCIHGHNTFKVGRTKKRGCRECRRLGKKIYSVSPKCRLENNLRRRLLSAIKNNYKSGSAIRDLGCTVEYLKKYLESKFSSKMTWGNWGTYWQLDHIKALCLFDLTEKEQLLKAVNYKNLQPLTIPAHEKKSAKDLRKILKLRKQQND